MHFVEATAVIFAWMTIGGHIGTFLGWLFDKLGLDLITGPLVLFGAGYVAWCLMTGQPLPQLAWWVH
jgi:hypothetical protein